MAEIWVLGTRLNMDRSGQLVRASDISHLLACNEKITAARIGSDDTVMLAHKDGVGLGAPAPLLPENFHLALLVKLGEARKQAHDNGEDLVVLPGLDDNKEWDWSIVPASELWAG
ncbi:hypothetical protein ACIBBE_23915 [Streptomyces sp. NPDC051644]|uniref:hypothetical protein n=1 Tax=Streptomyces sp. NPDC051644 TaxID=3365666 RepID=UPI0037B6FE67